MTSTVAVAAVASLAVIDPHYLHGLLVGGAVMLFVGSTLGLLIASWLFAAGGPPDPDEREDRRAALRELPPTLPG